MGSIRDLHVSPGVYTKIRDRKQMIGINKFRGKSGGQGSSGGGGGVGPKPQGAWTFDSAFPIVFS